MLQDGQTALHKASDNGHKKVVEVLLEHRANVNTVDLVCEDVRVGVNGVSVNVCLCRHSRLGARGCEYL